MYHVLKKSGITEIAGKAPISRYNGSSKWQFIDGVLHRKQRNQKASDNNVLAKSEENAYKNCELHNLDNLHLDESTFVYPTSPIHTMLAETPKIDEKKPARKYRIPKSKVRNKMHVFFNLKKSRAFIAFYSISFPNQIADNLAYKLLNLWLTRCRRDAGLKSYMWVSERQKNGTIHYHLLTNDRMNIKTVNNFMRLSLLNLVNSGQLVYNISKIENYNGIDVDNLYYSKRHKGQKRKFKDKEAFQKLQMYLSKYVSKQTEEFTHLCWHCSRDVSALFTGKIIENIESTEIPEILEYYRDRIREFKGDYFTHYAFIFYFPECHFTDIYKINEIIYEAMQPT